MPLMKQSLPRTWAILLASAGALLSFRPEWETDAWWHLALGRAVWRTGSRVVAEPYALETLSPTAIAPEWGWELATYGLWNVGGWPLLSLLIMGLAAGLAWGLVAAIERLAPRVPGGAVVLASTAALVAISSRMRLRPEAVGNVCLVLTLILAVHWRETKDKRWIVGAALFGLAAFWVQFHGSGVLAPVLFVLAGASVPLLGERPASIRADGTVFVGLCAAQLTGAWGLDVAGYVSDHATGTSVLHIKEFLPMSWEWISPAENPRAGVFLALCAAALIGGVAPVYSKQKSIPWRNIGLAFFGILLAIKARRFLGVGTILVAPLATHGLGFLLPRSGWFSTAIPALLGVLWFARAVDQERGPLGTLGLATGAHPIAAATQLERAGFTGNVFTGFAAGAGLGFLSDGRYRVWMDSRAPLYFDDLAFGRWRDAARDPAAFQRMVSLEDVEWAVVDRHEPACGVIASQWNVVGVDAMFTTFAKVGTPLRSLLPCGANWVAPEACDDPQGFAAEVAARAALLDDEFASLLKAEFMARCVGNADGAEADRPVSPRLWSWERADRLLGARIALLRNDRVGAVALLESDLRRGDLDALSLVGSSLLSSPPLPLARSILADAVLALDDDAPAAIRADLAWLCTLDADTRCVRDEAVRAASAGSERAIEPLEWLRSHGDARSRAEAERWLGILTTPVGSRGDGRMRDRR